MEWPVRRARPARSPCGETGTHDGLLAGHLVRRADPGRRKRRPLSATIETLFLDAGGVLANPNWNRVSAVLEQQGVEVAPAALEAAEPRIKRAMDRPDRIRASNDDAQGIDVFHRVLEAAGVARSEATEAALAEIRAYHAQYNLWEVVPEEVPAALERLRRLGLPLVVVSNANGTIRANLERLGLSGYFRCILDSAEEGCEKPDPRLFERALQRVRARPETTLHAGDFYEIDVVGARAAGLEAALIDVAGLQRDRDCRRFRSLTALVDALERGEL